MQTDSSLILLLPYIGNFPTYFGLFLKTCEDNPTVNWKILSPDKPDISLPVNVSWSHFSIDDLVKRVKSKLDIDAQVRAPYKVCDFRPAFGYLFPEHVEGYEFWGHCDADMLFGDIRRFMNEEIFQNHDKIQMRGAFSLYRNNDTGNRLFQLPHSLVDYREAFSDYRHWAFDEWQGLYRIVTENEISFYQDNSMAEITPAKFDLRLAHHENYSPQIFYCKDGRIMRRYWPENNAPIDDEFLYIHLQKRRLAGPPDEAGTWSQFVILPDRFSDDMQLCEDPDRVHRENAGSVGYELKYQARRIPQFLRRLKNQKKMWFLNRVKKAKSA